MKAAEQGAVLLTEDLRLQSAPVHDGRVYWVENIAKSTGFGSSWRKRTNGSRRKTS